MIWPAIERRVQPYIFPRWLEAWRVKRIRRALPAYTIIALNQPRRLFIDVSIVSMHDAGTGIQRTVRAVASQLLENPPVGWEAYAVSASRNQPYHPIAWLSEKSATNITSIVARPGDVFLGLDFALGPVHFHKHQLSAFKQQGGQLWFVIYDLLPIQRTEWFSDKLVVRYRKWFGTLAALADGFYCISPTVEEALCDELVLRYKLRNGFRTHVIPMGWDLAASRPSTGIPSGFETLLQNLRERHTALMVGTVEPRKGHAEVLGAFDILWRQGGDDNLVMAGRPGWKTKELQSTLVSHPQYGKRLFWLNDVSDEALTRLYAACDGVIAASHAEGFGLPIIEALGHGKSVLARDLPVFRLHEAKGVEYFAAGSNPEALAQSIKSWLKKTRGKLAQAPLTIPTWEDTARSIIAPLI